MLSSPTYIFVLIIILVASVGGLSLSDSCPCVLVCLQPLCFVRDGLDKNIQEQYPSPNGSADGGRIEAQKVPSDGGVRRGVPPLSSRLGGLGSILSEVRGSAPAGNAFWRILKATERSLLHLYADDLSSSNSVSCQIWGGRGWGVIAPAPT